MAWVYTPQFMHPILIMVPSPFHFKMKAHLVQCFYLYILFLFDVAVIEMFFFPLYEGHEWLN